ncbi:lycopene cyclase family protein [Streptomyces thermocarboxydus]
MFDSRPPGSLPAARTTLLQHFHGWFVRTARPAFAPAPPNSWTSAPRSPRRTVLRLRPALGRHDALVEYTEFSLRPLTPDAYETAVRHYTGDVLRLGTWRCCPPRRASSR